MYSGRLSKLDSLQKDPSKYRFGIPTCTYTESGTYIDNQGDYKTIGKYMIDSKKCLLKTFDENGKKSDTLIFEIIHIDNNYLLFTDYAGHRTWFYKKKL